MQAMQAVADTLESRLWKFALAKPPQDQVVPNSTGLSLIFAACPPPRLYLDLTAAAFGLSAWALSTAHLQAHKSRHKPLNAAPFRVCVESDEEWERSV